MINIQEIFENDNIAKSVSLWLGDGCDGAELAGAAEYASAAGVDGLSVAPSDVGVVWPWVEKLNVRIIARLFVPGVTADSVFSLGGQITDAFKHGADGAQVIVKLNDLERFADSVATVRDGLFFNKELSVGFDIFEIWPMDWPGVFDALKKLRANSLLLMLTHDDMEKSDFTGRIYAALQAWDTDSKMELHIMLNESYGRAEQVFRLVAKMRPELIDRLKFWVSY